MKYVCKICGYVYDDEKNAVPFTELPDSWVCPLCGAAKSDFEPQGGMPEAAKPKEESSAMKQEQVKASAAGDHDIQKLSVGELAAICSNLARGCEKQYREEASELFGQMADYFAAVAPKEPEAEISDITRCIQEDLEKGYEDVKAVAGQKQDRGALRVCVWGEKVTRILNMLLSRYEKEGEAFLANTEIWVCTTCGFVFVGENPPELCPVCKVPDWKFEKIEGRKRA